MIALETAPPPAGELALLPTRRVVWGTGSLARLPDLLDELGASRALVLTSRSLAKDVSLVAQVVRHCGPRYAGRFEQLPAHVPLDAVVAATAAARAQRADALVAFGGGSVIDAAKAVAARLADEDGRPALIVAAPTTLSGAEFADHYGVTEQHDGTAVKRTHTREDVTPAAVILDARMTAATPRWLWAGSAIKALDHAVEGMLCSPPRPVLDELAEAGISRLASALAHSLDPAAQDVRQACQLAAWYCYFAPASLTLGLSHRIGHVLGGTYGVPHAFTSGLTLPAVVRAMDGPATAERYAVIARALNTSAPGDRLAHLVEAVGLPTKLREVGIRRADVPEIARQVAERFPAAVEQLTGSEVSLQSLLDSIW